MSNIHPLALVEEGAKIGANVTIEPFAIVSKHVTLEDGVTIKSNAKIVGHTTIGAGSTVYSFAVIGEKCQDLKFQGEKTFVFIGKNTEIREFATINSSCGENTSVKVGDNCLIMTYCHVAHNCEIGNGVIMANAAQLAGHVIVEDYAIIGGVTPVHQFCRIGTHAMVGGFSRISNDVPPYTIGGGIHYRLGGLNLVGLKRHGFSKETRSELGRGFKILYRENLSLKAAIEKMENSLKPLKEVLHLINFCKNSQRGLIGLQGVAQTPSKAIDRNKVEDGTVAK